MSFVRILTIFAALVVLAVMLVLVYHGAAAAGFSEIVTLFQVLGLTGLLGLLTYDPRVMWRHCVRFGVRSQEKRDLFAKRMVAQLALYALISGIIVALVQFLSVSGLAGEVEKNLALWSLLYGVLTAVGMWVISGVDKPAKSYGTQKVSGDENQVILTFCVLLLTVGVLTMLFTEFGNSSGPGGKTKSNEMLAEMDSGMELGDDLVWRPVTLAQKQDVTLLSKRSLKVARGKGKKVQVSPQATDAPLRWELNLGSTGSYLTD